MAKDHASDEQIDLFDDTGDSFEGLAKANGSRYWSARDLMKSLGYEDWTAFKKVINRAMSACARLEISPFDNFIQSNKPGSRGEDFKLSRFACCLTALNGDPKKKPVAAAQAYFISLAEVVAELTIHHAESMDRLTYRDDLSDREVTLSKTAKAAGVEFYDRFQNAGYRGMYEMDYRILKRMKGVTDPKRSLLDFMGKDELAGNVFRLSLTEGRIKKENTRGQNNLEHVAEQVGRTVRRTMYEQTGIHPEDLPAAQDIKIVRKGLRRAGAEFRQLDNLDAQRKIEARVLAETLPTPNPDSVPHCSECAAGNPASHYGSEQCTSGSLKSGGAVSHCQCEFCY